MEIELKLRKADLTKDLKTINRWYNDWKMNSVADWYFPEDVFIIDGVICASYYKTNSKIAYMENVISNPDCPSEIRKAGLGLIGDYIFKQAKSDGFKVVIGWTDNNSVSKTSQEHGMIISKHQYAFMIKNLNDKGDK